MFCIPHLSRIISILGLVLLLAFPAYGLPSSSIIFVAQIPIPQDFGTVNATFGNQQGSVDVRGFGDLYIRYVDGTVRNLTSDAGYGNAGMQGASSISVRDPAVHWSGNKIIFSMVIGAPTQRYQINDYYWQLYEITNFGQNQTPVITKVANQPTNFNNVMPAYASDGTTIIFASDRPRSGELHLYPQRDEYESAPTNTGLWSLSPSSGDLKLLDHSPSGDFNPIIDSYGRVVFTRWDHLQRDQQADNENDIPKGYGAFNFSDETASASHLNSIQEYFPEHEDTEAQALENPNVNQHRMNQFFPWAMNQDGTNLETVNHVGRHELQGYIPRTFINDSSLDDFYGQYSRINQNSITNFLFIREDPTNGGRYLGIDCPEFGTHAAGQIVSFSAPPSLEASQISVTYVTHRSTAATSSNPPPEHSGLYRNPFPMSDGTLIASHTSATLQDSNIGTSTAPQSRYSFRIKTIVPGLGGYMTAGSNLTPGISKSITYWSPDELVSYNGPLWELQPVEVVARTAPTASQTNLESPELSAISASGTDLADLKDFLIQNNLALIISRNVTTRDSKDIQQPFNLKVANGVQTVGDGGKIYTVSDLQLFQGDQIRGYTSEGRRVLAVPLHDSVAVNPENSGAPVGSVHIASDGSMSALVPARRALTWQLTDPQGEAVVRERYWLTFQPGEIRVCASCHGITGESQAGQPPPQNSPQALTDILRFIKGLPPIGGPNPSPNSITIKISKPIVAQGNAMYRVTLTAKKKLARSKVVLKPSLAGVLCSSISKTVTLNSGGNAAITLQIPLAASKRSGVLTSYIKNGTAGSKRFAIPRLRASKIKSSASCKGVKFKK